MSDDEKKPESLPRVVSDLLEQISANKFSAAALASRLTFLELKQYLPEIADALAASTKGDFSSGNLYVIRDVCQIIRVKLGFADLAFHANSLFKIGNALKALRFPRTTGVKLGSGDMTAGNAGSYFQLLGEVAEGGDNDLKKAVVLLIVEILTSCSASRSFEQALKPAVEVLKRNPTQSSPVLPALIDLFRTSTISRSLLLDVLAVIISAKDVDASPCLDSLDFILDSAVRSGPTLQAAEAYFSQLVRLFPDARSMPIISKLSPLTRGTVAPSAAAQATVFAILAVVAQQPKLVEYGALESVLTDIKKRPVDYRTTASLKNSAVFLKQLVLSSGPISKEAMSIWAALAKGLTGKQAKEVSTALKELAVSEEFSGKLELLNEWNDTLKRWAADRDRMVKYDAEDLLAIKNGSYVAPVKKERKASDAKYTFFFDAPVAPAPAPVSDYTPISVPAFDSSAFPAATESVSSAYAPARTSVAGDAFAADPYATTVNGTAYTSDAYTPSEAYAPRVSEPVVTDSYVPRVSEPFASSSSSPFDSGADPFASERKASAVDISPSFASDATTVGSNTAYADSLGTTEAFSTGGVDETASEPVADIPPVEYSSAGEVDKRKESMEILQSAGEFTEVIPAPEADAPAVDAYPEPTD